MIKWNYLNLHTEGILSLEVECIPHTGLFLPLPPLLNFCFGLTERLTGMVYFQALIPWGRSYSSSICSLSSMSTYYPLFKAQLKCPLISQTSPNLPEPEKWLRLNSSHKSLYTEVNVNAWVKQLINEWMNLSSIQRCLITPPILEEMFPKQTSATVSSHFYFLFSMYFSLYLSNEYMHLVVYCLPPNPYKHT